MTAEQLAGEIYEKLSSCVGQGVQSCEQRSSTSIVVALAFNDRDSIIRKLWTDFVINGDLSTEDFERRIAFSEIEPTSKSWTFTINVVR